MAHESIGCQIVRGVQKVSSRPRIAEVVTIKTDESFGKEKSNKIIYFDIVDDVEGWRGIFLFVLEIVCYYMRVQN